MKAFIFFSLIFLQNIISGQNDSTLIVTRKLISNERFKESIPLLNAYLEKDTLSSEAYNQRGRCYRVIGEYDKAFIDLKRAISLDPKNAEAHNNLAAVYSLTGQYHMSIEHYNKSIILKPDYALSYNGRGAIFYYYLNENDKAFDDYNQALKYDPMSYQAFYNRAILYRLKDSITKAIADLNTALQLHPSAHLAYNERALCYYATGNYKKAIIDFQNTIKYNIKDDTFEKLTNGDAYYNIGLCYLKLGQDKKSEKYFSIAEKMGVK